MKVHNLSGDWANDMHPMAKTELGQYIDHAKGAAQDQRREPREQVSGGRMIPMAVRYLGCAGTQRHPRLYAARAVHDGREGQGV